MTLCIAGLCRLTTGKKAFVLCTDGRLDEAEWGHSDTAHKAHNLGYNTFGLMAGHWSSARELCAAIERSRLAQPLPQTIEAFVDGIDQPVSAFRDSRLLTGAVEIIVTGFIRDEPIMLKARIDSDRQSSVDVAQDIELAGEGEYAAKTLLKWRDYDPLNTPRDAALYLIYEAKKFSENVSSVGPVTRIKLHLSCRPPGPEPNQYAWLDADARFITELESQRKKLFIQPIPRDLNLGALEGPQSTIGDPSPPQPSPESPGGTDEF
jgi:hypothetical protein